jgi:DNA polymerase-3 subunit delta
MINFIYGDDNFRALETLKRIESVFVKEHGDLNIEKLSGETLKIDVLNVKTFALPFLGSKRLVIIDNLLISGKKEVKEELGRILKTIPESTDLIIFENGLPDKREAIFKLLDKLPSKQFFGQLDDFGLRKWISEQLLEGEFKISNPACAKLIAYVGPDLFRLKNEISRLIDAVKASKRAQIEVEDVDRLIEPNNNYKIFDLTDAIAQKNANKAIFILYAFKKIGEDDYRIFNLIIHQIRTMLIVSDLSASMTADQIAKEAGLHPFVVKKTLINLKNFSNEELEKMYFNLGEIDWKSKSGLADIAVMTELLIVDFCRK